MRVRLTLWYTALLTVTLLLFSSFLYISLSQALYRSVDTQLRTTSEDISSTLDLGTGQVQLTEQSGGFAVVYSPDMRVIDASGVMPTASLAAAAAAAGADGAHRPDLRSIELPGGGHWRVLSVAVTDGGRLLGVLQTGRSLEPIESALSKLLALMAVAIPLAILLAIGGGLFLAGRSLAPIQQITRAARRIGADDLSSRLNMQGTDEIADLAATFDEMIARLEDAFRRQRQFTADASHELRTPLTLMRTRAELALTRPRTRAEYQETLEAMRVDVERATRLVSDLLTLARADAGSEGLSLEPVALGTLSREVTELFAVVAAGRNVQLTWEGDDPGPTVMGDQTRLTQLLMNLVDNAVKYAAGASVRVLVGQEREHAYIRVADSGPGIPEEHRPHLFDRFYRVDRARSRTEGGFGLGLAISYWIARAHGGDITVDSVPGKGATFTVVLPLDGEARASGRNMAARPHNHG